MSAKQTCAKCGGDLRTQQVKNILTKYCDRCGPHSWGTNVKTGETVKVKR